MRRVRSRFSHRLVMQRSWCLSRLQHPANGRNRRPSGHVLPRLPVRQWVLSVPKRLRYHLEHDPAIETLALRIFLSVVEQALRRACPAAGPDSRIGAVAFIHRFRVAQSA